MRKKQDKGIAEVVGNLGFAFEVFKMIAHAVLAKGGTMQHLRRVVKEGELQRQIADLIVHAGSVTDRPLGEGEYRVFFSNAPLPSNAALEEEFGKGYVSDIFDGRPFQNHASCVNMDVTPGEKIFLVKHFGQETQSEANIAEMDALYRPATHLEAYEFQKAHPELQRQFWIVALGSFAVDGVSQCVAMLRADGGRRVFGSDWFGSRWSAGGRFLFVRK